ncbi:MAG: hypothetical protein ACK4UT_07735 [Moraxellaceae bacterium]
MKRYLIVLLVAGLVLAVVLAGRWLRGEPGVAAPAVAPGVPTPAAPAPAPRAVEALPSRDDVPLLPEPAEAPAVDAVTALREARLHGDPRAPAIERSPAPEPATPEELADPEAYQRYEARQNMKLYRDYVKAADAELPKLRAQIQAARERGLSAEELQVGEEKLRRIEAMRNQLLSDHPELSSP